MFSGLKVQTVKIIVLYYTQFRAFKSHCLNDDEALALCLFSSFYVIMTISMRLKFDPGKR